MTPNGDIHPVPKESKRDAAHLEHCRDLCRTGRGQCFVTGERANLVPHHIYGKHVDIEGIVLIVSRLHCYSNDSYHELGSYKAFDALHGTDSPKEAKRLYAKFLEGQS